MSPDSNTTFAKLVEIVAQLRGPNGCPWDKEQTPKSATPYIIEEAFEAVEAIESGNIAHIQEELGDLLLQPIFQAQLVADTSGAFTIHDVIETITQKLIVRHPHVFGDTQVSGSDEVLVNWEKIKSQEKPKNSLLDGLPKGLPALQSAHRVGQKASRVGFDWKDVSGVLKKVVEEVTELSHAKTSAQVEEELGDILFSLANMARHLDVDPEAALRKTTAKFKKRFQHMETTCKKTGRDIHALSDVEWDQLWNEAKT